MRPEVVPAWHLCLGPIPGEAIRCERMSQRLGHDGGQPLRLSGLALPDGSHAPASVAARFRIPVVTRHVCGELGRPEVLSRGGCGGEPAPGVSVPEASVNEDNQPATWQDDVWTPGQALDVQPESKPSRMHGPPEHEFRASIPPSDRGHHPAACLRVDSIHG
jgi:hypothetical protein